MTARKGLLLLAVLFAAGCQSRVDADRGRKYACDPAAEDPAQCPGGFVCGLEGYCHHPDEPSQRLCRTHEDCPTVDGVRWHCGYLNGFDDPLRCYDRKTVGEIACRYEDGDADCRPGWRCGVEGRCHDQTPMAYACLSDADCEGGWRCGDEGLCRDTTRAALLPALPPNALRIERLSPALPEGVRSFAVDGYASYAGDVALARDGGVTAVRFYPSGYELEDGGIRFALRDDLALPAPVDSVVMRSSSSWRNYYLSAVVTGGQLRSFREALEPRGKMRLLADVLPGASARLVRGIQTSSYEGDHYALFRDNLLQLYRPGTEVVTAPIAVGPQDLSIRDAQELLIADDCTGCDRPLVVSTSAGLFYAPRRDTWQALDGGTAPAPDFRPVHHAALPNGLCGGGEAADLGRVRFYDQGNRYALALERREDPAEAKVTVAEFLSSNLPPEASCGDLGFVEVSTCAACPPGATLVDFQLDERLSEAGEWRRTTVSRCALNVADGGVGEGVWEGMHLPDGACALVEAPDPFEGRQVRPNPSDPANEQYVDRAGRPWQCGYSSDWRRTWCEPGLLADPAVTVIGDSARSGFLVNSRLAPPYASAYRVPWIYEPGVGVAPLNRFRYCLSSDQLLAGVRGGDGAFLSWESPDGGTGNERLLMRPHPHLDWQPSSFGYCDLPPPLARLVGADLSSLDLVAQSRVFADQRSTAEGGVLLTVAAADRIWMGEITAQVQGAPSDAGVAELPVRAVPLPFATIEDLLMVEPPEASSLYATGYTVVLQRLFRIEAVNATRVLTSEIALPAEGSLVALFGEGTRARVGMSTGAVYSLPIPVPLAEGPLAGDDPVAFDFGTACGDTFAVGAKGLYRLETQGAAAVGWWRRLDLTGLLPDDPALWRFEGSRFHREGEALHLFTGGGFLLRLTYEGCAR